MLSGQLELPSFYDVIFMWFFLLLAFAGDYKALQKALEEGQVSVFGLIDIIV